MVTGRMILAIPLVSHLGGFLSWVSDHVLNTLKNKAAILNFMLTTLQPGLCLVHLTREYEAAKHPAEVQVEIVEKTRGFNLFSLVKQKKNKLKEGAQHDAQPQAVHSVIFLSHCGQCHNLISKLTFRRLQNQQKENSSKEEKVSCQQAAFVA